MFIFCPVHFWDFLKWVLTPSSSYFVIHPKQSFSLLPYCDKRSVWEVCSVADAISYFRICHTSPSFCITLLFSWIFHLMWVYSVDLPFFFLFNLATPLGTWDLRGQTRGQVLHWKLGVLTIDIQGSSYPVDFFSRPLCCYLSTLTCTHRHTHTEPPPPSCSSSSFCQSAYLHPSIEYINPSFWLQFFNSTFISPLVL